MHFRRVRKSGPSDADGEGQVEQKTMATKSRRWRKQKGADGALLLRVKKPLGLDGAGSGVPGDGDTAAEVGLVGHVAGKRGVVAEDGVFGERFAGFDG